MSNDIIFLVTILYGDELIKCAIKLKQGMLSTKCEECPLAHREEIHRLLPLHVQDCGPIVDVESIFEVAIAKG